MRMQAFRKARSQAKKALDRRGPRCLGDPRREL